MSVAARLVILSALAFGINPLAAEALKFEVLPTADNRQVLLIRDCGDLREDYQFGSDGNVLRDKSGLPLSKCAPWEKGFEGPGKFDMPPSPTPGTYDGDAATLRSYLQNPSQRFAQVWLVSGGGNLQQGVEIGRLLRAYRMTVRVPDQKRLEQATGRHAVFLGSVKQVRCVSSCTVAFMGGMFRYKDDDASYE